MIRPAYNPHLHRFAVVCAAATLVLICVGGVVTSKGVGMAVPDWPTTYGYNMFLFPIGHWVGGIFYEHTHRLFAAGVGLLTSILAGWLWMRETAGRARWAGLGTIVLLVLLLGHRGTGEASGGAANVPLHFKALAFAMPVLLVFGVAQSVRTGGALRWLGLTAFFAVIFQGILGGLRVALYQDRLGLFHAALAQLFLVLICFIAAFTSRAWIGRREWRSASGRIRTLPRSAAARSRLIGVPAASSSATLQAPVAARRAALRPVCPRGQCPDAPSASSMTRGARWLLLAAAGLVFAQLVIGATMRHQHAGLAVPDFPLAYGQWWPAMDAEALDGYNRGRWDVRDYGPVTAFQIGLHMTHRVGAAIILLTAGLIVYRLGREPGAGRAAMRWAWAWLGLILAQAGLGAWTVWSNKAADIATAHVALGAGSLAMISVMALFAWWPGWSAEPVSTSGAAQVAADRLPPGAVAGAGAR